MRKKDNDIEIINTGIIEETETITEVKQDEKQVIKKQSFLVTILSYKPILYFFFFIAIFIAFTLSKDYIFSVLSNKDNNTIVHKDTTTISLENEGFDDKIKLDKEKVTKVILSQLNKLENYKVEQSNKFLNEIGTILDNEFQNSFNNVEVFADWFYGYTTQYKILYEAGKGIVNNYRAELSDFTIKDAAVNQINDYISRKYKDLVLKPHILEPSLKLKIANLIQTYVNNKNKYIQKINNEFEIYLSQNPENLSNVVLNEIKADWESNISNSRNLITLKDKSGEGALAIGGISLVGAKILSGSAGKAMATKIITKFGFKKAIASMTAKVAAAPFTLGFSLVIGLLVDTTLNEMDEDGFIEIVDRKKDMINRGGENIYPREIEIAIESHPDVNAVAVVGVPDEALGERVKAVIEPFESKTLTHEIITEYLKDKLAQYKIPELIEVTDSLPRNQTGKILKFKLRGNGN